MDLIPSVHLAFFVTMLPKYLKYSTFSGCFWSIIICIWDGYIGILITLVFPTFISIPKYLTILNSLSIMPCITASSPTYSTLKTICPTIFKPPNLSSYTLPIVVYRQHPCLTHLSIFTLLVSPWSSLALTFWSMQNLLIDLLSRQSIPLLVWDLN